MHEYQIYVAHLSNEWLGSMSLFFVLHFTAAAIETVVTKSPYISFPLWLKYPPVMIALHTLWLSITGHLFIQPFYSAWAAKPLYGEGLNKESWSWIEYFLVHLN